MHSQVAQGFVTLEQNARDLYNKQADRPLSEMSV